jgi:hypothetical protein
MRGVFGVVKFQVTNPGNLLGLCVKTPTHATSIHAASHFATKIHDRRVPDSNVAVSETASEFSHTQGQSRRIGDVCSTSAMRSRTTFQDHVAQFASSPESVIR